MTKKEIKGFFKAIRDSEIHEIRELVNSNDSYLTVCNVSPPKKDDGQSGLQVAFKTGNFEIAEFLIERGADVNFMETSEVSEWRAPVLHDCIRATIFNSYTLQKDTSNFDRAFALLTIILGKNADPNAIDSLGNTCLLRAILDARQMIDNPKADLSDGILIEQLQRVFGSLIKAGADPKSASDGRESAEYFLENYGLKEYDFW
ncbi:MAG: hypothetical protein ABIS36_00565 [Chryseolinea sp.]